MGIVCAALPLKFTVPRVNVTALPAVLEIVPPVIDPPTSNLPSPAKTIWFLAAAPFIVIFPDMVIVPVETLTVQSLLFAPVLAIVIEAAVKLPDPTAIVLEHEAR